MYSGVDFEFIEFTNIGSEAVNMTGWSFDDDSRVAGTVSLSAFGTVFPGESVVLAEAGDSNFRAAWGLSSSVKVIGGNLVNLGRNDEINLYNASGNLVDRLAFGDQNYFGSVRTQNASCNIPSGDYGYQIVRTTAEGWVLASIGDAYGSWASTGGDIGSPGQVPEPLSLGLLAFGTLFLGRKRG
jgi:predicted extracellular nuclease